MSTQKMVGKRPGRQTGTYRGSVTAAMLTMAILVVVAGPAASAVFSVKLTNGTEIETRYRPKQSSHDEGQIVILTEHGNWITLSKDFVTSIESDIEARGFGTVLDSTTVFLGFSPNNAPVPGEGADQLDGTDRLIQYLQGQERNESFTVPQFVEPNSSGGIPLGFSGRTTPPLGSRGGEPTIAGSGG